MSKSNKNAESQASAKRMKPPAETPTPSDGEKQSIASAAHAAVEGADAANRMVPRVISLIVLVAVVLLVAAMFFRVMLQFIAPLFLAGVLVVIFEPVHKRVLKRLPGRPQWAALVTTTLVAFTLLAPTTWLGLNAIGELAGIISRFDDEAGQQELAELVDRVKERSKTAIDWYEGTFRQNFGEQVRSVGSELAGRVGSLGLHTVISTIALLVGLAIMSLALYYFFSDGPAMVEAFVRLSPLDDQYERELLEKFAEVSRAVVIATLLSAAAQGLLAGVGYYFALDGGPIFLLTAATMLMAIVPFVGATIVWVPVVAWVYFYQGDTGWAIGLGLWCVIVVSNIDNVIKPFVLHGQSNLHPLLALLSVLGGVSVLGPVGILVGPMLVAFLQALLNMLRKELDLLQGAPDSSGSESEEAATSDAAAATTAG